MLFPSARRCQAGRRSTVIMVGTVYLYRRLSVRCFILMSLTGVKVLRIAATEVLRPARQHGVVKQVLSTEP